VVDGGVTFYSPVKAISGAGSNEITVTIDKYGVAGSGTGTLSVRGGEDEFAWDGFAPDWEVYTGPITRDWNYIQLKVEF
jgi:hypothetical protein